MIVLSYLGAMSDNSMTIKDDSFPAVMEAIAFLLANPEGIRTNTHRNSVKEFIPEMREFIGGYGTESYGQNIQAIIESSDENKQLANYILSKLGVYPSYYPDTQRVETIFNTTTQSPLEIIGQLQSREDFYFYLFKQFLESQGDAELVIQFPYNSYLEIPAFAIQDSPIPKVFHTVEQTRGERTFVDSWQAVATVISDNTRIGRTYDNEYLKQENTHRSIAGFSLSGYSPTQIGLIYAYIYFSYLMKYYHFAILSENEGIQEIINNVGIEYELFLSGEQSVGLELFMRYFLPEIVFQQMQGFTTVNGRPMHPIASIIAYFKGRTFQPESRRLIQSNTGARTSVAIPNPDFPNQYKVDFATLNQQAQAELEQIQNGKTQQIDNLLKESPEGVQETLLQLQMTQGLNIPGSIAILRKYGQGSLADEIENVERTTNEAIEQLPERIRQTLINYQIQLLGISVNTGNQSSAFAAPSNAAVTTTSSSSSAAFGAGAGPGPATQTVIPPSFSFQSPLRITIPRTPGALQAAATTTTSSSSQPSTTTTTTSTAAKPRAKSRQRQRPSSTTTTTTTSSSSQASPSTTTTSSSSGAGAGATPEFGGSGGKRKRLLRRKTKKQRKATNKRRGTKKH